MINWSRVAAGAGLLGRIAKKRPQWYLSMAGLLVYMRVAPDEFTRTGWKPVMSIPHQLLGGLRDAAVLVIMNVHIPKASEVALPGQRDFNKQYPAGMCLPV